MSARVPSLPLWLRVVLRVMMSPSDRRAALSELEEMYHARAAHGDRREVDRWYRRQVGQYPFQLVTRRAWPRSLARRMRGTGPKSVRWEPLSTVFSSVGQSLRGLLRVPTLSATVIMTVGLGIGGCTAIFAVVDALYLRPLPYPEADRLVRVYTEAPPIWYRLSAVGFQALESQQSVFEGVSGYVRGARTFTTSDVTERLAVTFVTPGLFQTIGVTPTAGRTFLPEDGVEGARPTVVVTDGFAVRYLGAASGGDSPIGRVIQLDGVPSRVVGVLPSDHGPLLGTTEVFAPLSLGTPTRRGPFRIEVIARVRPGVEPELVEAELLAINRRLFPLWADSYQDERSRWATMSLPELLNRDVAGMIAMIMGAVGFLLLIAVTNAANLMLARVGGRRAELAVRTALGASKKQVVSLLLTESAILAAAGFVVGLATAIAAIEVLPVVASSYIPRLQEVGLSGSVLVFAGLLAASSTILFGLPPAIHGGTASLAGELRAGGRSGSVGARQQRYQRVLVAAQLAVAVPLLAGAGLLASSFVRLQRVDVGFDAERVLSARVSLPITAYPEAADRLAFWDGLSERVEALPGVVSVGRSSLRPPDVFGSGNNFDLEDAPTPPGESQPVVPWIAADPAYFASLGIQVVAGRMFNASDLVDSASLVALVDEAWAHRFFPGAEAVGRRFKEGGCTSCEWTTVVGVVTDVSYEGIGNPGRGTVYQPDRRGLSTPYITVRTQGDPRALLPEIRREVQQLDASVPLTGIETGRTLLDASVAQPRHLMWLLGGFSGLALLLSMVGLYGVTAHSVERQRGDIAIRVALGGASNDVLRLILGRAMSLVAVGLALGIATAIGVTRVLSSLLYDVSPTDPGTLVVVAALLGVAALVATLIPTRRAIGVDPASTLRED